MCAQEMFEESIPSTVSPAQYLKICHFYNWGPFAADGYLFQYRSYGVNQNDTSSVTYNMDDLNASADSIIELDLL